MNDALALVDDRDAVAEMSLQGPLLDDEPAIGQARERCLETLAAAASDWLLGLPLEARPSCTAAWYPHVINHLSQIWGETEARAAYFSELLFSRREGRRGFEALVMEELIDLQHFSMTGERR